jgi:hypothetical protein
MAPWSECGCETARFHLHYGKPRIFGLGGTAASSLRVIHFMAEIPILAQAQYAAEHGTTNIAPMYM